MARWSPFGAVLTSQLRFTLRRLAHKPVFTAVALLSLALGIAANTAIYCFVNAFQTHTAALESPGELVNIYMKSGLLLSHPDVVDLRDHSEVVFDGIAVTRPVLMRGDAGARSAVLVGEAVSGNYFDLLGVDVALGRPLLPADDLDWGGHAVVVLGHAFWQRAYGADPEILGREIQLANRPYTVVGVAPAD